MLDENYYPFTKYNSDLMNALLELKQRRAEDRQREYDLNNELYPMEQPEKIG